jgi:hypothetical protein
MELKSQIKIPHHNTGKLMTLREYITYEIKTPRTGFQAVPIGQDGSPIVYGVDEQQRYILDIVRMFEEYAYKGSYQKGKVVGIVQEFKQLEEQVNERQRIIDEATIRGNQNYLKGLID